MMTIHKYEITFNSLTSISVPQHSRFLSVDVIGSRLYAWYLVDDDKPLEDRSLLVSLTGQDLTQLRALLQELRFLGTVVLKGGMEVLHVFDLT